MLVRCGSVWFSLHGSVGFGSQKKGQKVSGAHQRMLLLKGWHCWFSGVRRRSAAFGGRKGGKKMCVVFFCGSAWFGGVGRVRRGSAGQKDAGWYGGQEEKTPRLRIGDKKTDFVV